MDPCCSWLFHREQQAQLNTLPSSPRRAPKTPSLVLPCLSTLPQVAPPEPQRLQEVDVHVIGLQSCRRFYDLEPITKEMLCASFFQGQKGFCKVSLL